MLTERTIFIFAVIGFACCVGLLGALLWRGMVLGLKRIPRKDRWRI